jgi:F-box protein, helicase, 18
MKIAKNSVGEWKNIIESSYNEDYYCVACGEKLERIFTENRQYFKHPKGISDDCENKIKNLYIKSEIEVNESLLEKELYNKNFDYMVTKISDYVSESGYCLTEEQKNIITSKESKIKIEAVAGSGKTETLYYYSKERPKNRILYLVYNKSAQLESEKTFGKLPNVTVKTIHSLAFGYKGLQYLKKNKLLQGSYNAYDVLRDLSLGTDIEMAIKVINGYNNFLLSDLYSVYDLKDFNNDQNKKTILKNIDILFNLKKSFNNSIKVEHDFYLKLFQLSKTDLSKKYDTILLDESQDSSLLVYDIIKNSNINNIVMCGDRFQQMYAWRNALNIMELFDGKEYRLSTSFRVSNNIAYLSKIILKQIGDIDIDIKGFNKDNKIINKINYNNQYGILCRTNAEVISNSFNSIEKGKKIFFEGGYYSYKFNNLIDAYYFYRDGNTNNPLFSKYKNYDDMIDYANKTGDIEILIINNLIKKYSNRIPALITQVKNSSVTKKEKCDLLITTIHRSKGQTYKFPIKISNDHVDLYDAFEKKYIKKVNNFEINLEELFIVYVAVTRGANEIELSDNIKAYFEYQFEFLKGC